VASSVVVVAHNFRVRGGSPLNRRTVRVERQTAGLTTDLGGVTRARLGATEIQSLLGVGTDLVVTPTLAAVLHTRDRETGVGASRGTLLDGVGRGVVDQSGKRTGARISVAACIGHVASVDSLVCCVRSRVVSRIGVGVVNVGLDARVTEIVCFRTITIEVVLEQTGLSSKGGHHTTTIVSHGDQIDSITVA